RAAAPSAPSGRRGRFPGARTGDELGTLLAEGRSVIGPMPRERREWWLDETVRPVGAVPGIAEFDPLFFEIAPNEAAAMDPRQRLLLEEMWKALEDAGCGREQLAAERVGVFVGVEEGDYRSIAAEEERITSNHNAVLAARLSYFLNLTGPGIAINTACSSSLVALHEACLSLRHGDCDTAVVASANLLTTPREYDAMAGAGMLSAQGVCRAFDKRADGMVPAEAVAVVVLKRRDAAERDGHRIYLNVLASGVNNDGKTNGITAPSGNAQTRLLQEVYERAGVTPDTLSHLVTHGTGTRLGDPIEINALAEAFRPHTDRTGFCALTSTKPNVGHALAASGLVSLIGLALGLRKEIIPPSINCEQTSDFVRWSESPFYISRTAHAWPEEAGRPRRAAVSSFGFSGTNAHVVVESHGTDRGDLARLGDQPAAPWHLLLCSARTETALARQLRDLADHLAALPDDVGPGLLASVSHTLIAGRHHLARRCARVVRDRADAIAARRRAADQPGGPEGSWGVAPREFTVTTAQRRALDELVAEAAADRGPALLTELARAYCQGHEPTAFSGLWGGHPPARTGLPSYAFDHAEYWVTHTPAAVSGGAARLHPLVHRNVSDVSGLRYASTFTARDAATDWFTGGAPTHGAVLELARTAVELGLGGEPKPVALHEVVWHAPIPAPGADGAAELALRIDLRDAGGGRVDWALYAGEGPDAYLVCDGAAAPEDAPQPAARLDLALLRADAGRDRVLLEFAPDAAADAAPLPATAHLDACLAAARQHAGWGGQGTVTALAEARFPQAAAPARWALLTPRVEAGTDRLALTAEFAAADGTVVAHIGGLTLSRTQQQPATAAQAPGDGRRSRMRGWTVAQCLAWELADAAGQVIGIPAEELDPDENLANYGIDSLNIAAFATQLTGRLGLTLTPDLFFSHPTLKRLETFLLTSHTERMDTLYREGTPGGAATTPAGGGERKRRSDRFAGATAIGTAPARAGPGGGGARHAASTPSVLFRDRAAVVPWSCAGRPAIPAVVVWKIHVLWSLPYLVCSF
ncbi:beta-ketoacyl synthase N-terminal-like domain-containing protein, partial [Streptomyces sp. HSW2009]|uniref:beta-ketoacyl synthase N-terminal-like domain-containing protein n=1 Tax=Streptomyces sp. HSW2009 TaxID=3142890 RepID=UPI0032EAE38C